MCNDFWVYRHGEIWKWVDFESLNLENGENMTLDFETGASINHQLIVAFLQYYRFNYILNFQKGHFF